MKKIFYFLGNHTQHITHALPLYEKLGGEFIVLSEEAKSFCEVKRVNVRAIDNYPEECLKFNLDKIKDTIDYLNSHDGIVFFYEAFNVIPELTALKKIMLFHGNSLKDWFNEWRFSMISQCDYISTLTPAREEILRKYGINESKFIRVGIARWDEIIKNKGMIKNQNRIYEKIGISNKKIVTYMPTWFGLTSVKFTGKEIIKNISSDYILLFRPHPSTPGYIIKDYLNIISKKINVLYIPENKYKDISLMDIYLLSDIFIADMSSVLTDSILTDKPIILALDNKDIIDYVNLSDFLKSILKKMVFFGQNPFDSNLVLDSYKPIQEIFDIAEKVNTNNAFLINEKIERSLNKGIDVSAWGYVKSRFFYDVEGHSVEKIINFVKGIL